MSITDNLKTFDEKKAVTFARFSTGKVTSTDGTIIGFYQIGNGSGIVFLHGGARAGHHYMRLAEALSASFTVYLPDRRGRGLSGPPGDNYNLQKELEDVNALLEKTQARMLFGHSAGGFFALEAALRLPVEKLALYEPAVSINGSLPLGWLPAFEQLVAQQEWPEAMVAFLKGLEFGGPANLPARFLVPFARLMLRSNEGREMIALLPTIIREIKTFQEPGLNYERYRHITAKTLLMGGAKSPSYLRYALREIAKIIPYSWLIELPKLDHNAPDQNAPEIVAKELRQFFL